ncbi:MAG TPA: monovalent cation/H+ antiporter complex subunit F [Gemmataceae bacterium]|nr:monovalent cation/H+ antiporter complex subunit F [Gemmataceae bacterium]
MNPWLAGTGVLLAALIPCGIVAVRAKAMDRLVAVELAGTITTLILVALAQALGRPAVFDLALALALLSVPAALVFAHFLERWL